jgi:hypothetical protein
MTKDSEPNEREANTSQKYDRINIWIRLDVVYLTTLFQ